MYDSQIIVFGDYNRKQKEKEFGEKTMSSPRNTVNFRRKTISQLAVDS